MSREPRIAAATLVRGGRPVAAAAGWRFELDASRWAQLVDRLRSDPLPLAALWSDGAFVHALLLEGPDAPLVASVAVENRRVLAVSPARPHAAPLERILRDLWGIEAMEALDLRPWLDHGSWTQTAPLSARPGPAAWPPEPPEFVWDAADEADGAMQLPVGPVQTLLCGPAQLRVTLSGERVRRVEPLLGFNHRGVAHRLRGLSPSEAAPLVGRIDATACVAHQDAFAQAVETAAGWTVGGATRALRQAMGALERIALLLRRCGMPGQRDRLLAACAASFGHRLMRDAIRPGVGTVGVDEAGLAAVQEALAGIEAALGSGPGADAGAIRRELAAARRGLLSPPPEPSRPAPVDGEGLGMAVSSQGPVWHWVRLEAGRIAAWHAADPTLVRLHALTDRARGGSLEALHALCASFDLPVSGADL